jgi:chromosome segregation ATPase
LTTKLEEARAAVEREREALEAHNRELGARASQQQALRRRIEGGGLLDDPSLQRQIDDLGAAIAYLREQTPRLTGNLQGAERSLVNVDATERAVREYLANAEADLRPGASFARDIAQRKMWYDLAIKRQADAVDQLRIQYDRLAGLVGETEALAVAAQHGRDLALLRGEPEPEQESEPTPKRRFGR